MNKEELLENRFNWKQLKEFCNSLSEEQLREPVILWREDEAITCISASTLDEDHYIDTCSDDGCFPLSAVSDTDEMDLKKVYSKGFPLLDELF